MKVAVRSPRRWSARCWSRGNLTSAWMPERKTRPSSWVYLASSENSWVVVVMNPPQGMAVSAWMTRHMVVGKPVRGNYPGRPPRTHQDGGAKAAARSGEYTGARRKRHGLD